MVLFCPNKKCKVGTGLCREGLHALPKTMFDKFCKAYKRRKNSFNSLILDIFQRLGHFLWKGMKPFPAQDMRPPISPNYPCKCLIVNGAILSQQKSGEVALVQGRASCPSKNNVRPIFYSGWSILQRLLAFSAVGTFFEEGHEALPCTGYASPEYHC